MLYFGSSMWLAYASSHKICLALGTQYQVFVRSRLGALKIRKHYCTPGVKLIDSPSLSTAEEFPSLPKFSDIG